MQLVITRVQIIYQFICENISSSYFKNYSMKMNPVTYTKNFSDEESVKKMPYQQFGKTGIMLSKLSLGAGAFGGEGFYGEYGREEAIQTVIKAIQAGVNFIDAGPHYGLGLAEQFFGSVLKKIPREAYYISTKVGRIGNYFNFKADAVTESFKQSLNRLQLDKVDIVFVHDVEFAESMDLVIDETLPAVKKFVESGKAKFIGISGYPLTTLLEIVTKSKVNIDCVLSYSRDTLIDDTLQEFIPAFHEKGIGVINAGCIGMRLLSNSGPPSWHPASQETKDICRAAAAYCKEKGVELGRLALYHALKQPGSSTCLVGMNDLSTLRSNLDILHNGINNTEQDVLRYLQEKFLKPSEKRHWEGIEVEQYRLRNECRG